MFLTTLILPRQRVLDFQYETGKKWRGSDLIADYDFPVYKSDQEIATLKSEARQEVLLVYEKTPKVEQEVKDRFAALLQRMFNEQKVLAAARERGDTLSYKGLLSQSRLKNRNLNPLDFPVKNGDNEPQWYAVAQNEGLKALEKLFQTGLLPAHKDTFPRFINLLLEPGMMKAYNSGQFFFLNEVSLFLDKELSSQPAQELAKSLLEDAVRPNLQYNKALTLREQKRVLSLVSPISGYVEKGRTIVARGDVVSEGTQRRIQSYLNEGERMLDHQGWFSQLLSQLLVVLLLTGILVIYLRVNQPRIYFSPPKLALILITLFLTVLAMVLALQLEHVISRSPGSISLIYLAPTCMAAVLLSNFFDSRTGFVVNLLAALFGAVLVQRGLGFAFVQIIAGTVAIYSLRRLRDRRVFFYTLIYMLIAYVVSFFAYELFSKGNLQTIQYQTIILLVFNVALTFLAYPSVYAFERIFGVTSDLAFLELLDTNHPLLHKLARRAPGTFQHSLQVANLAESIIQVIGGNALLVHVGALYHDIGKLKHPEYFIENTNLDDSPHNNISCTDSAEIIIDHVAEGIKMAEKFHLPSEIITFIETHHGTTRVEYFYRQFIKEQGCKEPEGEEAFRYPGPRPYTKETAALMIADSVEAASRAMKEYTEDGLRDLVNNIIDYKIKDKQLENAPVTFKDLAIIRKVLYKQLVTIYHGRIQYPELEQEKESQED